MTFPDAKPATPARSSRWIVTGVLVFVGLGSLILVNGFIFTQYPPSGMLAADTQPVVYQRADLEDAPELAGGTDWLNTSGPLTLADLRGKIVVLDFWTLCCINCIHTMPDLAKLREKYPNEVVVIGVHSPKFENEKDSATIRAAILRYDIKHPVVNDADMKIWDAFAARAWPTVAVIDPEGKYLGQASGEGNFDLLDRVVQALIKEHKEKGTLNEEPMRFDLLRNRVERTPLFFPGKVHADAESNRLFIADSTHHRIVVTDLTGKKLDVIGTGTPGWKDGSFEEVQFDDPQGMALRGDTLYIADRKNHVIREADLKARTVRTIAGTGKQDSEARLRTSAAPALKLGLNSPWDLWLDDELLFIAMAGSHQIWTLDLAKGMVQAYAGDGRENIKDGPLFAARFAQPSGLTSDGENLYVADCEVSAIRQVPMNGEGRVKTLVGEGLFDFGDIDGIGEEVRLQHALGVAFFDGKLYVADTYNNKIKVLDPETLECVTYLGGTEEDEFDEPAGLSISGDKLYVADTNAHRIRVVDLKTKEVSTLELEGVESPIQDEE